jgi:hypothetical protein
LFGTVTNVSLQKIQHLDYGLIFLLEGTPPARAVFFDQKKAIHSGYDAVLKPTDQIDHCASVAPCVEHLQWCLRIETGRWRTQDSHCCLDVAFEQITGRLYYDNQRMKALAFA